jgi:hypothetical protein
VVSVNGVTLTRLHGNGCLTGMRFKFLAFQVEGINKNRSVSHLRHVRRYFITSQLASSLGNARGTSVHKCFWDYFLPKHYIIQ